MTDFDFFRTNYYNFSSLKSLLAVCFLIRIRGTHYAVYIIIINPANYEMWFSRRKDDVREKPRRGGGGETKTEIEPYAALTGSRIDDGSNYASSRRESNVNLCYYYFIYYTLIHRTPRKGRSAMGPNDTRPEMTLRQLWTTTMTNTSFARL